MRLQVTIDTTNKFIPFEYHGFLQGVIYHALNQTSGTFFHDIGFGENRIYKMFVFSELKGKYEVSNGGLIFKEPATFCISSISSDFMNQLFLYFTTNQYLTLGKQKLEILDAKPIEDVEYHESQEYILTTLSPITCYKTDEKHFTTYFHPKSQDFENSLKNNLSRKFLILYNDDSNEFFEIKEIKKCKEMKVKFKRSIYVAYLCTMKVHVSDRYLKLLLHAGLGSKNAAGFGMMKIIK